jgi:hypothetical protein
MTYVPQTEYYYYDQPAVGIKNRVSEKIRVAEEVLPTGDTLSAYRSIQQIYPQSESYTRDVNYVEVAFSPQNEINDDINSSMGYFNIGDYIGDPAQFAQSGSSYPPLDKLRDTYFEKYYKNYNWTDYIRLIRYFDNSLFKMIKDFIPARTSLASGVVIKQHLLERNRQAPPQVTHSEPYYTSSVYSQQVWDHANENTIISSSLISKIVGGSGGTFNNVNTLGNSPEGQEQGFTNPISPFVTQSWSSTVDTPVGPQIIINSSQAEFYNGEFSGSEVLVTNGDLNSTQVIETANVDSGFIAPYSQVYQGLPTDPFPGGGSNGDLIYTTNTQSGIGGFYLTHLMFFGNDDNGESYFDFLTSTTIPSPGDIIQVSTFDGVYNKVIQLELLDVSQGTKGAPDSSTLFTVVPYYLYYQDWYSTSNNPSFKVNFINDPSITNLQASLEGDYPLLNNVPNNRLSDIYQDVDYADGSAIPVNFNLILNGQAVKFPIPDSNYSQKSWSNGRYNGSRVSSRKFNG